MTSPTIPGLCGLLLFCAVAGSREYDEAYRPQFHFTYKVGWLGDINGLVHFKGEYHLFTQHCPGGPELSYPRCHWGHAVSRDLIHWEELPPALAPDENGPIFSGSAVVDRKNASRLGEGEEPPLLAFYTGARYMLPANADGVQCMAYSLDRGRTWSKYPGNPVLEAVTHYNRDPKVLWHEPTRRWILALSLSCASDWLAGDYRFAIFSSPNLKEWTEESRLEMKTGLDCPDLFELPVDGDPADTRWVFWAGDGTHRIGRFDGKRFTPEGEIHRPLIDWLHDGANGYAAQTFHDTPPGDGRRIQIAWLRHGSYPGMRFNGQTLFPCELTLRTTPEGIRLFREPIEEIETLHGRRWRWEDVAIGTEGNPLSEVTGELLELRATLRTHDDAGALVVAIRGEPLRFDPRRRRLSFRGQAIPAGSEDGSIRLQILIDRTSLEVFADEGRTSMSFSLPPKPEAKPLAISMETGEATAETLTVWRLRSIW